MRRLLSLLLAVCLGLSLPGCGPQEDPAPSPEPTQTPAPTQRVEAAQFRLGYDPSASLHPITSDSQVNQELTGLVYQGLYELDNEFAPQPVLAASGAPSEDGYSWTFTLKAGAVFSDGTPVTAWHAAASLNLARTSALYAARLSAVTGAAAADDATLNVTLSAPNGDLPALLDIPVVLEREEGAPLGTGYYQYESAGDRLYLQVNAHHAGGAALPWATIPLTAVSTAGERIAAFDSGDITAVTTEFSDPYALGYASSYETCDYPTTSLLYVGFKTTAGACRSELVRQAFSKAFHREELVQTQLAGHGDPACLPISPLHGAYSEESAGLLACDLEGAAALLAQAGYEPNPEDNGLLYLRRAPLAVTLLVNSDNESRQGVAGRLAQSLRSLGVSVTVETLPWKNYTEALARGQFDLYIGETRLTGDFDCTALLAGELNYGGYESGTLAQALGAWRAARGEARDQAAQALWAEFAQAAPIAPLCFKRGSLLVRWGMASNLQPTRANPFRRMEEWSTTAN